MHEFLDKRIQAPVLEQILEGFRYDGCEHGGLLYCRGHDIYGYYIDKGVCTSRSYRPGEKIRKAIFDACHRGDEIVFVHSHAGKGIANILSQNDILFAREFLTLNLYWDHLLMALVADEMLLLFNVTQERIDPVAWTVS